MRFAVSYKRHPLALKGAADVTFWVEAGDAAAAEAAAAQLYTKAYGQTPGDDYAELVSVRLSERPD